MMTDTMDAIFRALASAPRRRILDVLKARPGITVGELAAEFPMSRIAVMKHLRVLEEADLVTSRKEGRTRRLHLNPVPIQFVYDRWTTEYSQFWAGRLADIKYRVERGRSQDDEQDD
jgi:DNA-binding transcriptional ArsR family regulator